MALQIIFNIGNLIAFIVGVLVIIITLALNIFIILSVILDKSMRNYTNVQFASMSIADLLVVTIAMPLLLASHLFQGSWPYNENVCIFFIIGDFVGGNISIITLMIISYHRLNCIKRPYEMKKKSMFEFLFPALIVWPFVCLFWTLLAIYIVKVKNRLMKPDDCFLLFSFQYVIVVDLLAYVFPICLLIYFQISIYLCLRNKNNFIKPTSSFHKTPKTSETTTMNKGSELNKRKNVNKLSRCHTVNTIEYQKSPTKTPITSFFSENKLPMTPIIASFVSEEDESISRSTGNAENHQFSLPIHASGSEKRLISSASLLAKVKQNRMAKQKNANKTTTDRTSSAAAAAAAAAVIAAHNYTKNKKAFRILFWVTCSLIMFWMPWIVAWPVQAYCNCLPRYAYALTYWLEYLNSLINSIILIVGNQHFRKKFLSLFINFK